MELKCPHCGSTSTKKGPYKNMSALNTHINVHCPKNPKLQAPSESNHTHKFALLKPITVAHARAIEDGYTKICDCGEII
jgi:hypothetical protein